MGEFYLNVSFEDYGRLYVRWVDEHGKVQSMRGVDFNPPLYREDTGSVKYVPEANEPLCHTLNGTPLRKYTFGSAKERRALIDSSMGAVYNNIDKRLQLITDTFGINCPYDSSKINLAVIDIEVLCEKGFPDPSRAEFPINSITYYSSIDDVYHVFSLENKIRADYIPSDVKVKFKRFVDEKDLLFEFLTTWTIRYPDILIGWNSAGFDLPYIINRMRRLLGEEMMLRLSPVRVIRDSERMVMGKFRTEYTINGISHLDYMDLYKKFRLIPRESYSLDNIALVEVDEAKISYVGSLAQLFQNDYQKFVDYNIHDVRLILKLNTKLKLIELVQYLAYYAGVNFDDVMSPVRMWDAIIYNYLLEKNIMVPPKPEVMDSGKYIGAYVKESKPGKKKFIVSVDFTSLYPSIIRAFNIGPETLREDMRVEYPSEPGFLDKSIDVSSVPSYCAIAANGEVFDNRSPSILSILVERVFSYRKATKRKMLEVEAELQKDKSNEKLKMEHAMLDTKQMAMKVLANALYGSCGNKYFRYYDVRIATAITVTGRYLIQWTEKVINAYMNRWADTHGVDYVIAGDTDSLYINMEKVVKKFPHSDDIKQVIDNLDQFADKYLEAGIRRAMREVQAYLHNNDHISMKREAISDVGIFAKKKHYILRVHNSEGVAYDPPKLKIMGMRLITSSIPEVCRKILKDAIPICLDGTNEDLSNYIKGIRATWRTLKLSDIAVNSSINNIGKYTGDKYGLLLEQALADRDKIVLVSPEWYANKAPMQVKAAINFNYLIDRLGIEGQYMRVLDGTKSKIVPLRSPNHYGIQEITLSGDILPPEFKLDEFVDYDALWIRNIESPLNEILSPIGWSISPERRLF